MPAKIFDSQGYINFPALVGTIWRARWLVAVTTFSMIAVFAVLAFTLTPIYRASAMVITAESDRGSGVNGLSAALSQLGGLASLAGLNLGNGGAGTEESLAVLRSRELTEAFIRDRDLLPELFRDRWDPAAKKWRDEGDPPTMAQAYALFDKSIRKVSQDRVTGLVTVQIEWRDAEKAAEWANALVERLNMEMRARAINSTNASIGFLEQELTTTSTIDARQAIGRLMEAQINQRMLANVTQEYAFRVVDRAMPPDPDDEVAPKKLLLLIVGAVLGFALGTGIVLVKAIRRHFAEAAGAERVI